MTRHSSEGLPFTSKPSRTLTAKTGLKEFEEFWAAYPRREKRRAAEDAFVWAMQNHNSDGLLLSRMLTTIEWQRARGGDPKYWPMPNRWILDERWTDECPALLRAALVVASEPPEERAARRARVEAETAERFARERAQFERRRA